MALNKSPLAMDPALIKYQNMATNRHQYFRWTGRTAWISFVYVIAVPFAFGYVGYKTDGKYDLRGKLRGNPIKEF